jgi:hypothetical protein
VQINIKNLKRLAAQREIGHDLLSQEDIMHCLANETQVRTVLERYGQRFKNPIGKHEAAKLIQSIWRMYQSRKIYRTIIPFIHAANVFAKAWRHRQRTKMLKDGLKAVADFHEARAKKMMRKLKRDWKSVQLDRAIIHLPGVYVDSDLERIRSRNDVFTGIHRQFSRYF